MCIYIYIYIYIHMYVYVYIYIYMYVDLAESSRAPIAGRRDVGRWPSNKALGHVKTHILILEYNII